MKFFYSPVITGFYCTQFEDFLDEYEMQYQDVGVAYPEVGIDYTKAHRLLWWVGGLS